MPPDKVAVVALALHGGQAKTLVRNPKPEIPQPRAEGLRPRFPLWASVDCGPSEIAYRARGQSACRQACGRDRKLPVTSKAP